MKLFSNVVLTLFALLIVSCSSEKVAENGIPYNLNKPDREYTLPKKLREISGMTWLNDSILACVQDEKGNLYLFNLNTGEIDLKCEFGKDGDFEALNYVNGVFYAMRSNGNLYAIHHAFTDSIKTIKLKSPLSRANDTEALCFLKDENALLIACKGLPLLPDTAAILRKAFYKYSIADSILIEKPAFFLNPMEIGLNDYKPTDMDVQPAKNLIYVLGSRPDYLTVIDFNGKVINSQPLTYKGFIVPESLCFSPSGTLYIASEGKKKNGTLLVFEQKK